MTGPNDAPTPALAERFTLAVAMADPIVVGTLATGGVREHHPVIGGRFDGAGERGELIGGSETLLKRPDNVQVLEAVFLVRTDAGGILRIVGTGYRTVDGPFIGTRMSVVFEVDEEGPHTQLSTRAWIAERADAADHYIVAEIL